MKKLIVANWKMNPQTAEDARRLFVSVEHRMHLLSDHVETVVCPPFVFLPLLSHYAHYIRLGAQNLSGHEYGAYTGEISAKQLIPWNIAYAILGHSERRIYFGETDRDVNTKIKIALEHHITPVVCLGGEKKIDKKNIKTVVSKQLRAITKDIDKQHLEKIVYVYEPTWAISSMQKSQPATGEHALELITHIRKLLSRQIGKEASKEILVLYGGTVNKTNVHEFAQFPEISGALVGFASLEPNGFFEVISEFHRESIHKV